MDSHHQPPDSKSGAPLIELQGYKWSRLPVLPRSDLVYKTSAWLLCQAGMKWRKPEVMLPIPRSGTICFRNSPGPRPVHLPIVARVATCAATRDPWSGRQDLHLRSPVPKTGAFARLSYAQRILSSRATTRPTNASEAGAPRANAKPRQDLHLRSPVPDGLADTRRGETGAFARLSYAKLFCVDELEGHAGFAQSRE